MFVRMTMRAVVCEAFGPPEALVLRELPLPEPGPGEVRVRVHAASVNFPDALVIQNLYQSKPPLPFVPGCELAGEVDAVGEGVTHVRVGQRVAAALDHGAFAEAVLAPAHRVLPIGDDVSYRVAAAFTLTYGTSYYALVQRGQLAAGESLLVLGAAGGVGLAAVEIGKALGAKVIAGASTAEKLELARAHGADVGVDYRKTDLRTALAAAGQKQVDVVYDPVGTDLAEPAFRALAWNGRFLVIGFAGGTIPKLPLNLALVKGASAVGVFWGSFVDREPAQHAANMRVLFQWLAEGKLRPHVGQVFPFARTGEAIRTLMQRKAEGKVVIDVTS